MMLVRQTNPQTQPKAKATRIPETADAVQGLLVQAPSCRRDGGWKRVPELQGGEGGAGSGRRGCQCAPTRGAAGSASLALLLRSPERSECLFSRSQYPFVLIGLSSFAA
ncbi:unnamed protein product [Rangifer tarandus platyrhynchus]|uniref:Uncharacterized protein n=2 Tax=Rangifer tarandus platyrhynchus TaxID=3082113 RepID=A0ABN8ZZL7_RANTA|nr:unnamed protein product [Rangifer tarandus platyrhynchus]CAI9711320.1 unnamed protein product [Rangifer tarandus platyrhynchus]